MTHELAEEAQIVINRDADNDIKMRGLEVFIDDEFTKDLSFGNGLSQNVCAGEHTIKVTNHLYTRRLRLTLNPGETSNVQIGNYFDGLGGLMMSVIGFGHYKVFVKEVSRITSDQNAVGATS